MPNFVNKPSLLLCQKDCDNRLNLVGVKEISMDKNQAPGFLPTFIGSFLNFKKYPEYSRRSLGSMLGHYFLLVTLCCSFYALATTAWCRVFVSPFLDQVAQSVPEIRVKNGLATIDIEQPYFAKVEGQTIAVIDTTQSPEVYLEKNEPIIVVSADRITSLDERGKIESFKYSQLKRDFTLNSDQITGWVDLAKSWFLPTIFLVCFLWQVSWKAFQTLAVAAVITLFHQSRPPFGSHLKLAILALGPAMVFGVIVYAGSLVGAYLPGAGICFWAILGGLTIYGAQQLRNGPRFS